VLAAAVLGTALAYMSDDMLNLAVPSVARDFGATMTDVQLVLNAYYVPLVSFVLIAGSIGDIVGHRRVFSAGLVLFALGALVCATSPSVLLLALGRGLQGVAAAMLLTAGLALVVRLSTAEERGRAAGLFFGLVAAVPAFGPFLSGALVDLLSWRWLFVAPLVLPLAALVLTRIAVPETPAGAGRRPDVPGALAGLTCLFALSVALIAAGSGSSGWLAVVGGAVAVAAGFAFVRIERRSSDPMLPLHVFRSPVFLAGNLIWLLAAMTSWGAVFLVALNLQVTLGLRPLVAGAVLVPIYLVMMLGSPLAGRLSERVGHAPPILAGLGTYAVGLWLLSAIDATSRLVPDVVLAILVFAVGMATFTAPLAAATLASLDDADQGVAAGVNNAMGQLAGLLAIVVLPLVAGLGGASLSDPAFAAGSASGLRAAAVVALGALVVAALTFRRRPGLDARQARTPSSRAEEVPT
jgi:EmrB/QacA subfamily drug resistance transporter